MYRMSGAATLLFLALLEEEEEEERRRSINRRIIRRNIMNVFNYPENEFVSQFRVSKEICLEIIEILRPALEPRTYRKFPSVETKVLCALRFYATGSIFYIADNISKNMCKRKVSGIIKDVTKAINELMFHKFVKFPTLERELKKNEKEFYEYSGFPGVIGAIDCTHVAIMEPPEDRYAWTYINEKQFYSLSVQLVSDMQLKIISISARFPGSTEDEYVWWTSKLRDYLKRNSSRLKNTWLLGDSAYPLEPWLMTPVKGASPAEESYNKGHKRVLDVVEQCNILLKSRFQCLLKRRTLQYIPTEAGKIVNACAVLHNMCIDKGLFFSEDYLEADEKPFNTNLPRKYYKRAKRIQKRLINFLFEND